MIARFMSFYKPGVTGAVGPHGSDSYLTGPMAPDLLPALGRVRRRHVSPRKGSSEPATEDPGPLIGVRNLLTHVRTSHARRPNIPPGGSGATTYSAGAGASLPLEDSPAHRIQCGRLRRALPPRLAGQTLSVLTVNRVLPRYTVQPPASLPCRARLPH